MAVRCQFTDDRNRAAHGGLGGFGVHLPVPVGFGLMAVVCVRKLQNPDAHLPVNPLDAVAGE